MLWFRSKLQEKIPGIIIQTKTLTLTKRAKAKPNCYAFHLTATYQGLVTQYLNIHIVNKQLFFIFYFRYLRGLELMQVPKPLKNDLGGGTKEFTIKEVKRAQFLCHKCAIIDFPFQ